jgi:hypothetical protein
MRSLYLLYFILAPLALAESRVFVSQAGTLLEAEIIAVSSDNVSLRRSGEQQPLLVKIKTLCKEDADYIARWQEHNTNTPPVPAPSPTPAASPTLTPTVPTSASTVTPAQKYRITCQTLPSKSNRGPADSDHRVFEYTYNFNLSNQEVRRDLQNARGLALTLGKKVAESNGDLIVLQKEEFEVNIRAQSKIVHSTQPVRLTYSQDPDYAYGVKNYGYVLIIRDAAGNILLVEASPDTSAKFTKEILAISEAPCVVDRDFRAKPKTFAPMSYISF